MNTTPQPKTTTDNDKQAAQEAARKALVGTK